MSTTVVSDAMAVSAAETTPPPATTKLVTQTEIEFAKCNCCGLTEECTPEYIEKIRQRYQGKWICGLCAEVIKDEIIRTGRLISTEEAMTKHKNYCKKIKSSGPPSDAAIHLITAMKQILRRSLDSPRGLRSTPNSPTNKVGEIIGGPGLTRSESCLPSLSG